MKLFLLRHAEGENYKSHWQSPDTQLSSLGGKQALAVPSVSRFSGVEKIFSSPYKRTMQTAEVIAQALNKPIIEDRNLIERKQSSKIFGVLRTDPLSIDYSNKGFENRNDPNWKWDAEEESVTEVLQRGAFVRDSLVKDNSGNTILFVSHERFLCALITSCVLGDGLDSKSALRFYRALHIDNTGISLLIFNEENIQWKLWYVNDYSHLGNIK